MKSQTRSGIYIRAGVAVMAVLAITSAAYSQTKVVELARGPANAPVELINLKSQDQQLKFGKRFDGGHDWLKDLSFSVKNISQKNIVHISLAIDFTEIRIPAMFRHDIFVGRPTNTKCCQRLPQITLKPGDSLSVSLSSEYERFSEVVEKHFGENNLSTITVVLNQVHFDDGTRWDLGYFHRPDPERPGQWVPID